MEKVYNDPEFGKIIIRKRSGTRRISLRVHFGKGIFITIPYYAPYRIGLDFFLSKKLWIADSIKRQKQRMNDVSPLQIEELRAHAKEYLPTRLAELASRYGFSYNQVRIKHNFSNWGSCSSRRNINLNLNLMRVPAELQDYVMLHELCHLHHMNHGQEFHALLESVCPNHLVLQKQLRQYKLI